ncbi:hypothetical protein Tco_1128301, partial [Tanacetum coccineum]
MSNLKFAETHNLVAFLEKSEESDGFEGIIDFLNASSIRYALTVNPTNYTSCIKQFWATAKAKTVNGEVQIQDLVDGKKVIVTETSVRRALQLKDAEGEGLEIPVDPQHTTTIIQPSTSQPQKKQPRRKQRKDTEVLQPSGSTEPITDEAANEEHVPTHSNDPLLSGEDILKLNKLMELYTNLSQRVLNLENTKTSQAAEITKFKERVKKLERRNKSRTLGLKRLRKFEVTLVDEAQGRKDYNLMLETGVFDEQEVEVEKVVSTAEVTTVSATTIIVVDELTLAQTLIEIKEAKPKVVTIADTTTTISVTRPKARGIVVQEPSEFTKTTLPSQLSQLPQAKDKSKAKMVGPEKPLKKKDQVLIDEEIAQRLQEELQAELEEEERLARQKEEEANITLIESWDNTQAMMDADYELTTRLQSQEQEELTIEEKSKLFIELMDKRKKHFARLRAEEQRRKPPTKAQKRNKMSTYLKHMAGYKQNQLKIKNYDEIQKLFDKAMKRVNMFVDKDTYLVKESSKKAEMVQ